jgi:hypothetical protein
MPTVIDALVVTLGLDAAGYDKGAAKAAGDLKKTKEQAEQTAKDIEAAGRKAAEFYTRIRNEAIAMFAVFTAGRGVKDFARDIIASDAATGRLAKQLGVATQELNAWEEVAKRSGDSVEGADSALSGLSQSLATFATTGVASGALPYLYSYGIQARSLGQILTDLNERIQSMPAPKQLALINQMGLGSLANTLMLKPNEFRAAFADVMKLGVLSPEDARVAQEFYVQLSRLEQVGRNLGRTILADLLPPLTDLANQFIAWVQSDAGRQFEKNFVEGVERFGRVVRAAALDINSVVQAMGGWVQISEEFFALWAASKVVGLLASISQIVLAFRLMRSTAVAAEAAAAAAGGASAAGGAVAGAEVAGGAAAGAAVAGRLALSLTPLGRMVVLLGAILAAIKVGNATGGIGTGLPDLPDDTKGNWLWDPKAFFEKLRDALGLAPAAFAPATPQPASAPNGVPRVGPAFGPQSRGNPADAPQRLGEQVRPGYAGPALGPQGASGAGDAIGQRLQQLGWSPEQAAGIAANIQRESSFNPREVGDGGLAYGLGQWHPDRQAAFKAFKGFDIHQSSFQDQVDFINYELTRGAEQAAGQRLKGAKTAAEAGAIVSRYYERPRNANGEASARGALAEQFRSRWTAPAAPSPGAFLAARERSISNTSTDNSSKTNFHGDINITTPSADPNTHADLIRNRLSQYGFVSQANYGLA